MNIFLIKLFLIVTSKEETENKCCNLKKNYVSSEDIEYVIYIEESANCTRKYIDKLSYSNDEKKNNNLYNLLYPFFSNESFENFYQYATNFLKNICTDELKQKCDELALKYTKPLQNEKTDKNIVKKIINDNYIKLKFYDQILKNVDSKTSSKNTELGVQICEFIDNHDRMIFYNYFIGIFETYYDENTPMTYKKFIEIFENANQKIISKIETLKNHLYLQKKLQILVNSTLLKYLKFLKFDHINLSKRSDDEILWIKNNTFRKFYNEISEKLDPIFKICVQSLDDCKNINDDFIFEMDGKDNDIEKNNKYEISFNNSLFTKKILLHFKKILFVSLKTYFSLSLKLVPHINITSKELTYEINVQFEKCYRYIFFSMSNIKNEKIHYVSLIEKLEGLFENSSIIKKHTFKSIIDIFLVDSLVEFDTKLIYMDHIESVLEANAINISKLRIFVEIEQHFKTNSAFKLNFYKNIINNDNESIDKKSSSFCFNNKSLAEKIEESIMIYVSYNNLKITLMSNHLKKILKDFKIDDLLHAYNVFQYKNLLYNQLQNSNNDKFTMYQLLKLIIKKLDKKQIYLQNKFSINIAYFEKCLLELFYEFDDYEITKIKLRKILKEIDIDYFKNEFLIESDRIVEHLIIDLINISEPLFENLNSSKDYYKFFHYINIHMENIYYLCLLSHKNMTEMRKCLLNFIENETKQIEEKHENKFESITFKNK
ncbi:hypothetical protein GVAV_001460 [Gurleya vavrai]